jgi:hypothetical protein
MERKKTSNYQKRKTRGSGERHRQSLRREREEGQESGKADRDRNRKT